MPILKISDAKPLDKKWQLPWHAAQHILTICDRHLTQETKDLLYNHPNDIPSCGGAIFAETTHIKGDHYRHINHQVFFECADGCNISDLPHDLRTCIIFAAKLGFSAIEFEPFDKQDCPVTEYLTVYT